MISIQKIINRLAADYTNWRQEEAAELKCPSEVLLLLFVGLHTSTTK